MRATDIGEGTTFRVLGKRKWRIAEETLAIPAARTKNGEKRLLVFLSDGTKLILSADDPIEMLFVGRLH